MIRGPEHEEGLVAKDASLRANATVIQQPNTARKQVNFDKGLICCGSSQSNLTHKDSDKQ